MTVGTMKGPIHIHVVGPEAQARIDRGEGGRTEPRRYVILSLKHSPGPKGDALWWGTNQCGYVGLDDAGRYSEVQAKAIANGHHADTKDMWPTELGISDEDLAETRPPAGPWEA